MNKVFDDNHRSFGDAFRFLLGVRPGNLGSDTYRHLLLLLFWPLYGIGFYTFELILPLDFHPIYCVVDDWIPFCEWFVIPYYWWFVILVGMVAYTALFNFEVYYRYMYFIIITYSVTLLIYLIYPSSQELRPEIFPRDNILTRIIGTLYATDSNENVCPSIHVLGAVGAGIAGLQCRRFATVWGRIVMWVSIITICMSTVMIKQHSIIDVFVALALCAVVYPFTFGRKKAFYRPAGQPTAPVAVD
ncbi:MAG: phosphatidic acid phosphatase [Clostridia bacterium]|nr:phosphatidic acid phosphatase [Clostridia bacterium]